MKDIINYLNEAKKNGNIDADLHESFINKLDECYSIDDMDNAYDKGVVYGKSCNDLKYPI